MAFDVIRFSVLGGLCALVRSNDYLDYYAGIILCQDRVLLNADILIK